ncbi:hypothetical protein BDV98DRAFT_575831 [Pterulicium gracile]|uniref:Ig-like domain-containing protein n=1 Tax=Pterulicium gracile TaxID=1884261 RepID=A0A5C3Q901_9AGAR|nr:hypothetical protein BDV98DRAFT_575831 [Pterula gracilis]
MIIPSMYMSFSLIPTAVRCLLTTANLMKCRPSGQRYKTLDPFFDHPRALHSHLSCASSPTMFSSFILVGVALANVAHAMPAVTAAAEQTTTVTVIHSTTEPWPHVCPTTVGTTTTTSTAPITTTTATAPVTTQTKTYPCWTQGCGAITYPGLTPVGAAATAAPKLEDRALTTITQTHVWMEPTCVEWRSQTKWEYTTITDPSSTATATSYLSTVTASVINEMCEGWDSCPGSPYQVTGSADW